MITRTVLLFLVTLAVSGCENNNVDTHAPSRFYGELVVGGRTRTYLASVPAGAPPEGKLPLVLMFHGTGGSAGQAERDYGWTQKSTDNKFMVVYPEGAPGEGRFHIRTWNAGKCCQYAMENNIDDVRFVNALLDYLIANYPVDQSRIYAAGMSNGAMLAYRLACELPGRFAAIAAVSGTMMVDEPCHPSQPTPLLHIHSETDTKVPYAGGRGLGGYYFTPVDSAINVLKAVYGCNGATQTEEPGYIHRIIDGCPGGKPIETYLLKDGGHSWPGGQRSSARSDIPSTAIHATNVIWEFFTRYEK